MLDDDGYFTFEGWSAVAFVAFIFLIGLYCGWRWL